MNAIAKTILFLTVLITCGALADNTSSTGTSSTDKSTSTDKSSNADNTSTDTTLSEHGVVFTCVGMNEQNKTVHVIFDVDSQTLNVDGDIYKIEAPTNDNKGVATVDLVNSDGVKTYYSLDIKKDETIYISEYNSKTDDLLSRFDLSCHK